MRPERPLSLAEEIANSVIHGIGLVASLAAVPVLVVTAAGRGDAGLVVGSSVFAATLVALYAASTIYHALPPSRAKQVFRVLDHVAIYLLIAGTYTPFTLGVLRGAWGWTLFGIVWGFAALGILLKLVLGPRYSRMATVPYLLMGWLGIVAIEPVTRLVPFPGIVLLVAGGLVYTVGVAFFLWERQHHHHAMWHGCVLGGSACHFFAVLWYAAPLAA